MQERDFNIEERYSSLDIPTHGSVPKWLEDMSNDVKRSKSVVENFPKSSNSELNNNTNKAPKIAEEYFDYLLKTPVTVQLSSARHGRRAAAQKEVEKKNRQDYILDEYIVPKINNLQLNEFSNLTEQKSKEEFSKKIEQLEEIERYTPSILDKENGPQATLEPKDELKTKKILTKATSVTEFRKSTSKPKIPKSVSMEKRDPFSFENNENIFKLTFQNNLLTSKEGALLVFDETYKNKLQKYSRKYAGTPGKRVKYKKYKFRQNFNKKEAVKNDFEPARTKVDKELFIIPELPSGKRMTLNILSTWGDRYYVGLNGIEIFDSDGFPIKIKKVVAPDVNSLPECVNDPRVAENLFDGENRTHDDCHLWLAPFDSGKNHHVHIEFEKHSEVAMMRIWNYNKSRIHSYRGARYVEITLDDVPIFKGEIAKACGSVNTSMESYGDTILFTTQESILERVSRNDKTFQALVVNNQVDPSEKIENRPTTATENNQSLSLKLSKKSLSEPENRYVGGHKIDLVLMSNWGRNDFIGLTGLEVMTESETSLNVNMLSCNFKGNLSKLVDGENVTDDPNHMWNVIYNPIKHVVLTIQFEAYTYLSGVRIWNYNENIEKSFGGVRTLKIFLDNKLLPNPQAKDSTFLLRRAPGNANYDYHQQISFVSKQEINTTDSIYDFNHISMMRQDHFEAVVMPEGFVIQIVIYTTWGDQYYTGLNAIQLYDHLGRMILLTENNICAHPESVNVLPGISGDIRTPDKLIDGINEDASGANSWLAPIVPKCLNRIYIVFDQPVTISVIKFWNYLKTPSRGVREFGILFDDLLVYNGILDKADESASVKYQSILFTNNSDVIKKEMATIVKHNIDSQGTELTNETARMTTGGSLPNVDQSLRPFTSVHQFRGRTSQSN